MLAHIKSFGAKRGRDMNTTLEKTVPLCCWNHLKVAFSKIRLQMAVFMILWH